MGMKWEKTQVSASASSGASPRLRQNEPRLLCCRAYEASLKGSSCGLGASRSNSLAS